MKTMKWLIKREMWEHKGMLVWAPTVIAALIAVMALVAATFDKNISINGDGSPSQILSVTLEGKVRTQVVETMAQAYMASSAPVLLVLGVLVFFYCLGALHDERRDRSLLFWKSLPVSDSMTVLSKVLLAAVVAPLITLGIGFVLSLLILFIGAFLLLMHGTNVFGELLLTPDLYLTPLRMLGLIPLYVMWALPTVGWLLMVSSMARSKVFLWAVGTPLVTALLLLWAEKAMHIGINSTWFVSNIVSRLLLSVVPGAWLLFDEAHIAMEHVPHRLPVPQTIFGESWATLGNANVWIGVAAGAAMIAVAIWMRRRREEG
jgi:ABC-2 type transport system permease protein